MHGRVLLSALLMIVLATATVTAQFNFSDPGLDWQVLETEHFRIVFHSGLESSAQRTAAVAEDAYEFWAAELGYAPEAKTNIILMDNTDFAGGSANSAAKIIAISTSRARSLNEWRNSRDEESLDSVTYHEIGHVIDLSGAAGFNRFFRSLFGSAVLPTATKPGTFTEGIPIYEDYRRTGGERAADPRNAMYMREMLLNDKFPPLDNIFYLFNYNQRNWPSPYMITHDLGPWLVRYMGETYGPASVGKFNALLASDPRSLVPFLSAGLRMALDLPSGISLAVWHNPELLHKTLGVTPQQFYDGFKNWLHKMFDEQVAAIKAEGVTESKVVSRFAYWNNKPAWSPRGDWIAYFHTDPDRGSQLRLVRPSAEDDHAAVRLEPGQQFFRPHFWSAVPAWSPDATKLIYAGIDVRKNFYQVGDLYLYDVKSRRTKRLTYGERAYRPVFAPDGQKIIYAVNNWGDVSPALYTRDLTTGQRTLLKELPEELLLDSFSLSPDGQQLALSFWRRGGFQDIYTMWSAGGDLTAVTQDKATDLDPTWTPDGQYIIFNSDRSGVNNLYAYRASDGSFARVTNVVSGAFHPSVSPEGKQLAFVGYSHRGYDVRVMDLTPEAWKPIAPPDREPLPKLPSLPSNTVVKPRRYSAGQTMAPPGWVPILSPTRLGLSINGQDALRHQFYSLRVGVITEKHLPFYSFSYSTAALVPPFTLAVNLTGDDESARHELRASYPLLNSFALSHTLTTGLSRNESKNGISHTLSSSWSVTGLAGLDLLQHRYRLTLTGELAHLVLGDRFRKQLVLEVLDTMRLPTESEQMLALRLNLGWSDQEKRFSLGGRAGRFLLRGWPENALRGSQILSGSAEWRFPLFPIRRAVDLLPIYFSEVRGALFVDAGSAGEKLDLQELKLAIGCELRLVANLWGIGPNFRLGVAQGIGQQEPVYYFELGSAAAF